MAIVGRPNVGKSTLFNRILGRREAIVDDQPGVTRDRKVAEAEWQDVYFDLVDTGGYIPKTLDKIEEGVTQQVKYAIENSDLIMFVADCTTGITDVDQEVAELLRKHERSCLLVINKSDDEQKEWESSAFFGLGLGNPIPVAALGGRGIGDLLAYIIEKLEELGLVQEGPVEQDDIIQLAVVGKPNVGKSTFINTVLGEERLLVTDIPGTTRDAVDIQFEYRKKKFSLIDTAGMRKRTKVKDPVEYYSNLRSHHVIERCHIACLFIDANEGMSHQDISVLREVVKARKGIVIVINKWDLIQHNQDKKVQFWEDVEYRMKGYPYIPLVSISCKTGLRVDRVLGQVLHIQKEMNRRVSSANVNRLLEKLNQIYRHPSVQGKQIRVMYGTQTKSNPPVFVFFSNYPLLIKTEYKRFLEKHLRETFGFRGAPLSIFFKKK